MDSKQLTAEEFAALVVDGDFDFEQQRSELVEGRIVAIEPPDLIHGAIVLNLTKAIAEYLQRTPEENGYACFEIGLITARRPDTVRRSTTGRRPTWCGRTHAAVPDERASY